MGIFDDMAFDEAAMENDRLMERIAQLEQEMSELEEMADDRGIARQRAYLQVACEMLDYMDSCREKRLVPLAHDVNVFRGRLQYARKHGKGKR